MTKDYDLISRQAAIDELNERQRKLIYCFGFENDMVKIMEIAKSIIIAIPSAQPNLSEAYSKAVVTWLMDYQIRAAELNGRYAPYEVLSWVINDWRKENG